MKTVTVEQVMDFGPCKPRYTRKKVVKLFAGRKRVGFRTIAQTDIPPQDRVWLLLHMMTRRQQHEAACRFAEAALNRERAAGREPGTPRGTPRGPTGGATHGPNKSRCAATL